jgi:hypothetical protein
LAGLAGAADNSELLQAVAADIEDGIEVLQASNLAPDAVATFEDAAGLIADGALDEAKEILEKIPSMILEKDSETVAGN